MSNPNIQDSQPKKINWAIVGIAGAVIVGGGAYTAWQLLGGKELTPLQAAELIPQDALMTGYISTDSQAWSKLDKFGTPEARKIITQGVDSFKKQVLAPDKISYEEDLQPWMGNIMFAMLPDEKTGGSSENMLVIFGIKNKLKALDFANKLKSQSKGESKESDYKGETLVETKSENGAKAYYVVVGDRIVFTSERKNLEKSIDTLKGSPSIATTPEAKELLSKGVDVANPVAKFWITDYAKFVKQIIASNPNAAEIPAEMLAQLDKVKAMEVGVGIVNTGFHFQSVTKIDPSLIPATYKTTQNKILAQLPANTILAVNGQNIGQNWTEILKQIGTNTEFNQGIEELRNETKKNLQLDLDKDLIGLMDGEFAIAFVETQQGATASYGMGGSMLFETSDRAKMENTIKAVDTYIATQSSGFLSKQEKDLNGKKITEWSSSLQNATVLAHGWLNDNSFAISMGTSLSDAVASDKNNLKDSESFKTITGTLPNNNYGYFYLNMDKFMAVLTKTGVATYIPADVNAFMTSVSGAGGTVTLPDKSTSKTDMLLNLKPTK